MDECQSAEAGRPKLNRHGQRAPAGPWWDEPDRIDWTDPSGLKCRALRGPFGAWCGYVGLRAGHPMYGLDYSGLDVEVHGGLTFAGHHADGPPDVWWLGFDCAHAGDYAPGIATLPGYEELHQGEVYRDVAYVRAEIAQLAAQLGRVTPRGLLGWAQYRQPASP